MQPDLNNPEVRAITSEAQQLAVLAAKFVVVSSADYGAAGGELNRIKAAQKRLDEVRKSITRPIDAAKKAVMDLFRGPEEQLGSAERGIKNAMISYQQEQERIRREEQRKADEAARKERERIEAQARELERKAREKADAERRAAAEAAAAGRAEEAAKLAAKAAATEAAAAAKAEASADRAASIVAPIIVREPEKAEGIATRKVWKFEVIDESVIPRAYLRIDDIKIRGVVTAMKDQTDIPGVRVYAEEIITARA